MKKNIDYISIDKKYNVKNQVFIFSRSVHFYETLETEIENDFNIDMIINFLNNIYYKHHNVKNDKARLQHEYQFYDHSNLFYKKLINKSEGNIDLENNTIILVNKLDINIKSHFKKLKIVLMLHRINRKGYGNINLDIFDNIQNNYININYKTQINTKNNLININRNKENINVNNNNINTNENNIKNNFDKINTN